MQTPSDTSTLPLDTLFTLQSPAFLQGTNMTRHKPRSISATPEFSRWIEEEVREGWTLMESIAEKGKGWVTASMERTGALVIGDMKEQLCDTTITTRGIAIFSIIGILFIILIRLSLVNDTSPANSATSTPISKRRAHTPPHLVLQRYIHPATSLWPEYYLRAFHRAETNAMEGGLEKVGIRMKLSRRVVMRDLGTGDVFLRDERYEDLRGWEGVEWS